jgi:hypothetical protein
LAPTPSARGSDPSFWTPRTGGDIDAVLSLVRRSVQELTGREPPLNSPEIYLNDHGDRHIQAVLANAQVISRGPYIPTFQMAEQVVLCCAIWLHDIGLFATDPGDDELICRKRHADRSAEFVLNLHRRDPDVISETLAELLAELCRAHRRNFPLDQIKASPRAPELPLGFSVHPALLGALLRICDAADAGQRRTPAALYQLWQEQIPEESRAHWVGHGLIHSSSIDARSGEVTFHLIPGADPLDPLLRELYVATSEDLDSTRSVLKQYQLAPWDVRYELRGQVINPGVLYAKSGL